MNNVTVQMDLPRDILGALDIPETALAARLRELIVVGLRRESVVSTGKAAELLGVSKLEFVRILDRHGVPYFARTLEELRAEVAAVGEALQG